MMRMEILRLARFRGRADCATPKRVFNQDAASCVGLGALDQPGVALAVAS
jgi:hypothetical protein